jgi:Domain of unknown function (DUF4326)
MVDLSPEDEIDKYYCWDSVRSYLKTWSEVRTRISNAVEEAYTLHPPPRPTASSPPLFHLDRYDELELLLRGKADIGGAKPAKNKRIQRRRTKGWRMPSNAVYVGRRTKYGNPYTEREYGRDKALELYSEWLEDKLKEDPTFLDQLRGKDLACWCRLNERCHADILLAVCSDDEDNIESLFQKYFGKGWAPPIEYGNLVDRWKQFLSELDDIYEKFADKWRDEPIEEGMHELTLLRIIIPLRSVHMIKKIKTLFKKYFTPPIKKHYAPRVLSPTDSIVPSLRTPDGERIVHREVPILSKQLEEPFKSPPLRPKAKIWNERRGDIPWRKWYRRKQKQFRGSTPRGNPFGQIVHRKYYLTDTCRLGTIVETGAYSNRDAATKLKDMVVDVGGRFLFACFEPDVCEECNKPACSINVFRNDWWQNGYDYPQEVYIDNIPGSRRFQCDGCRIITTPRGLMCNKCGLIVYRGKFADSYIAPERFMNSSSIEPEDAADNEAELEIYDTANRLAQVPEKKFNPSLVEKQIINDDVFSYNRSGQGYGRVGDYKEPDEGHYEKPDAFGGKSVKRLDRKIKPPDNDFDSDTKKNPPRGTERRMQAEFKEQRVLALLKHEGRPLLQSKMLELYRALFEQYSDFKDNSITKHQLDAAIERLEERGLVKIERFSGPPLGKRKLITLLRSKPKRHDLLQPVQLLRLPHPSQLGRSIANV